MGLLKAIPMTPGLFEIDARFFDKSFSPKGWYDRDTNTTFEGHNRPSGTIYDFDRD
ncbi:MAG: hypothetical protein V1897_14205 [Pseudomonadota bacterium]